jgi:hypothetical protein
MGLWSAAVLLALHWTYARVLLAKRHRDRPDFGVHSSREDHAASTALGDCGRAESDVETIARSSVFGKGGIGVLLYRERFTSQKCLVGFEVNGFNDTASPLVREIASLSQNLPKIGGDSVASLELNQITNDYFNCWDRDRFSVSDSGGSWRTERT